MPSINNKILFGLAIVVIGLSLVLISQAQTTYTRTGTCVLGDGFQVRTTGNRCYPGSVTNAACDAGDLVTSQTTASCTYYTSEFSGYTACAQTTTPYISQITCQKPSLEVSCSASPGPQYPYSSKTTFTASVSGGTSPYTYTWSGVCAGVTGSSCIVPLTEDTSSLTVSVSDSTGRTGSATCSVEVGLPSYYILSVGKSGDGSGVVTSNPSGISCGADCSSVFKRDSTVTLSASADSNSTFTGWTGEFCSGTGSCSVTMDWDKTVGATFAAKAGPIISRTVTFACTDTSCTTNDKIKISNIGESGSVLFWKIDSKPEWLAVSPESDSVATGSSKTANPSIADPDNYIPGFKAENRTTDSGTIRICDVYDSFSCQNISVKVNYTAAPIVQAPLLEQNKPAECDGKTCSVELKLTNPANSNYSSVVIRRSWPNQPDATGIYIYITDAPSTPGTYILPKITGLEYGTTYGFRARATPK